ncbi:hypothetical protein KZX46_19455 [Polymorphobacter sp. PAMC 29334]|uniref:hypothetical protein n=1 Tax=Polymorphobacter sp. PAMC 29334 TaxID=2862331 RepID=UPI001C77E2AB|nr:hypothetical protein [Polymorphobacter sp. PAMC 29334]QYE34879.1 hypothetical protein KZX46_19455 [Polymorphobacter sp. PAMC 29334]
MRNIIIAAITLAGLIVAAPAAAVIEVATYIGTASTGSDVKGLFGSAAGNLAGVSYVATFTYDTSLGVHLGSTYDEQYVARTTPWLRQSCRLR